MTTYSIFSKSFTVLSGEANSLYRAGLLSPILHHFRDAVICPLKCKKVERRFCMDGGFCIQGVIP